MKVLQGKITSARYLIDCSGLLRHALISVVSSPGFCKNYDKTTTGGARALGEQVRRHGATHHDTPPAMAGGG